MKQLLLSSFIIYFSSAILLNLCNILLASHYPHFIEARKDLGSKTPKVAQLVSTVSSWFQSVHFSLPETETWDF